MFKQQRKNKNQQVFCISNGISNSYQKLGWGMLKENLDSSKRDIIFIFLTIKKT